MGIMMLGTALFSIQAFTGEFYSSALRYTAETIDETLPESGFQETEHKTADSSPYAADTNSNHSMNSSAETKGFLAVPWIPAGYIRQAMTESSLSQTARKSLRGFVLLDYPSHDTIDITDRTVRNRTNPDYSIQILMLDISRLTAG
jgi:hypothetical protein